MYSNRVLYPVLLAGLSLCSGCAGLGPSVAGGPPEMRSSSWTSRLFRRGPEPSVAATTITEVPSKLKNPTQLSLAYARLMAEAGNLPEAETHFSKVLEDKPENLDALLGLAKVHQLAGRYDQAEQMYLRALKHAPKTPAALHGLGQVYAARGRWDEATELLSQAVLAAPQDTSLRYDLAVALVEAGNIPAALPHFINTVGDAEAHYNIGLILHRRGRLSESEQHFRLALAKKPDLQPAQQWLEVVRREQLAQPAPTVTINTPAAPQGGIQPVSYEAETLPVGSSLPYAQTRS